MIRKSTKKAENVLFSYLGWFGVGMLLVNYMLLSSGIVAGTSVAYQTISLLGCALIVLEAWHKKDFQPVALNLIFVGIAFITLLRISFFQ